MLQNPRLDYQKPCFWI